MATKFNFQQFNKPTPHKISVLIDFLVGFISILNAWMTTASFISHHISDIVGSIVTGLLIPLALLAKRMFGTDVDVSKVAIEEVSEIKEPSEISKKD